MLEGIICILTMLEVNNQLSSVSGKVHSFLISFSFVFQIRERYNVTKEEAEDLKRKVEKVRYENFL